MTTSEAWRWVAHHWAYALLRWAVLTTHVIGSAVKRTT